MLIAHKHMNLETWTVAAQFLFWEYLFQILGIGYLQCVRYAPSVLTHSVPALISYLFLRRKRFRVVESCFK